jgi:hypothetical protein
MSSETVTEKVEAPPPVLTVREILNKSAASAAKGGTAGALAMGANVAALMWIRTTVRESKTKQKTLSPPRLSFFDI